MSRILLVLASLLASLLASPAGAEVLATPTVSSTETGAVVSIGRAVTDLLIINDSTSANEVYLRIFYCGEPGVVPTAGASGTIRLEPGESISVKYLTGEGGNGGYCQFGHITQAAETATLRYVAK